MASPSLSPIHRRERLALPTGPGHRPSAECHGPNRPRRVTFGEGRSIPWPPEKENVRTAKKSVAGSRPDPTEPRQSGLRPARGLPPRRSPRTDRPGYPPPRGAGHDLRTRRTTNAGTTPHEPHPPTHIANSQLSRHAPAIDRLYRLPHSHRQGGTACRWGRTLGPPGAANRTAGGEQERTNPSVNVLQKWTRSSAPGSRARCPGCPAGGTRVGGSAVEGPELLTLAPFHAHRGVRRRRQQRKAVLSVGRTAGQRHHPRLGLSAYGLPSVDRHAQLGVPAPRPQTHAPIGSLPTIRSTLSGWKREGMIAFRMTTSPIRCWGCSVCGATRIGRTWTCSGLPPWPWQPGVRVPPRAPVCSRTGPPHPRLVPSAAQVQGARQPRARKSDSRQQAPHPSTAPSAFTRPHRPRQSLHRRSPMPRKEATRALGRPAHRPPPPAARQRFPDCALCAASHWRGAAHRRHPPEGAAPGFVADCAAASRVGARAARRARTSVIGSADLWSACAQRRFVFDAERRPPVDGGDPSLRSDGKRRAAHALQSAVAQPEATNLPAAGLIAQVEKKRPGLLRRIPAGAV